MSHPTLCRSEAFAWFSRQLPTLHTTDSLLQAALAVAMHADEDLDPWRVDQHLHALADRVRRRIRNSTPSTLLAHLHEVLFREEGFCGDCERYTHPINNYLPFVLQMRHGVPISLSLVYKVVAERVGLEVEGIDGSLHFLVRVRDEQGWLIVDPFFCGAMLTPDEAARRITANWLPGRDTARLLSRATHTQWVSRLLTNLQDSLSAHGSVDDLAAMIELQRLLQEVTT